MVYIPFDVFARIYRINAMRNKKEIEKDETWIAWNRLLDMCPRNDLEWKMLFQQYGTALRYNWTIWTPYGRKPAPKVKKRWLKKELGFE